MADPELALVPPGWKASRLDSLATETRERAGVAHALTVLSVTKHSGIVRAEDYFKKAVHGRDTANYKVVRMGDLAYATIHLDEGSIGVLEREAAGIVSPMYTVFRPTKAIEARYLFWTLKLPASIAVYRRLAEGTVNRRASIDFDSLGALHLVHPPLGEQRKIAAILSSVDDAIEATQAVIDQLRVVKKAMMSELLTRGIPGRHTRFKQTEIGEVPEEWMVERLSRVARLGSGGTPRRDRPEFWNGAIPWVKTGEITYGLITKTEETVSQLGLDSSAAKLYPAGTLLMAMYGQGATRGRVAMLGIPATVNQACLAISPSGDVDSWFLFHVFVHLYEQLRALGHEGTQKNLNAQLVGEIPLPIPPVEEQRDISSALDILNARTQAETEFANAITMLKSALIAVLLTGEVRVTPNEAAA